MKRGIVRVYFFKDKIIISPPHRMQDETIGARRICQ